MDSLLQICDTCWKTERGYCYLVCYDKTYFSFLWYSFSFSRHLYFKNMCQTGKFWDPKIRAQRWIWFSQYVTPVGKLREVFVLWCVRNKNLLPFCKMILQSLRIIIWKWWLSIVKTLHFLKRSLILQWNFGWFSKIQM